MWGNKDQNAMNLSQCIYQDLWRLADSSSGILHTTTLRRLRVLENGVEKSPALLTIPVLVREQEVHRWLDSLLATYQIQMQTISELSQFHTEDASLFISIIQLTIDGIWLMVLDKEWLNCGLTLEGVLAAGSHDRYNPLRFHLPYNVVISPISLLDKLTLADCQEVLYHVFKRALHTDTKTLSSFQNLTRYTESKKELPLQTLNQVDVLVTHNLWLTKRQTSYLIGSKGSRIELIRTSSKAKIKIFSALEEELMPKQHISITGTKSQVQKAVFLIQLSLDKLLQGISDW
ncbi:BA75_03812T0 [Komagataella pastoris]|uniref:BA75_03812T0 n=1 Tax=Komagataella pastoris TaxID=4922 RepID=A0A1B2JEB0_PICPA|nr:BA75_03812T0 [Komagataella pastoris]